MAFLSVTTGMGCGSSSQDDTEEKDKEDDMDVEDVHSVDSESKRLETGSEGGTN